MLGQGRAFSWLDPICLHLTSERVKERSDALARLKEITCDEKLCSKLDNDGCCRIVKSFFRMLEIEFKYSNNKGETLTNTTTQKLHQIILDGKTLLSSLVNSSSLLSFEDSLDDVFEATLALLKSPHEQSFSNDILSYVNVIMESDRYLFKVLPQHAQTLLEFASAHVYGGQGKECSRLLFCLSRFFYEMNAVDRLKSLAHLSAFFLSSDLVERSDQILIYYLLKGFKTCLDALHLSHPIFCRSIFDEMNLDRWASLRKPIHIGQVIDIFIIFASLGQRFNDSMILKQIETFIISQNFVSRLKLDARDPLMLLGRHQHLRDESLYDLLKLISLLPLDIDRLMASSNQSSYQAIKIFAMALNHCTFTEAILDFCFSYTLVASSIDLQWLTVALGNLASQNHVIPDSIVKNALNNIGKTNLTDCSVYLLDCCNNGRHRYQTDIIQILSRNANISAYSVRFLSNYLSKRYKGAFWSRNALDAFALAMETIRGLLSRDGDPRHSLNRLVASSDEMVRLLSIFSLENCKDKLSQYQAKALAMIDSIYLLVDEIGQEAAGNFIKQKFNLNITCLNVAVKCIKLPFLMVEGLLKSQKPPNDSILESLNSLRPIINTELLLWIWKAVSPLLCQKDQFRLLHVNDLISFCISCLDLNNRPKKSLDEFQARISSTDVALSNPSLLVLHVLASIFIQLSSLGQEDLEIKDVLEDCELFMFENILSLKPPIDEMCKFVDRFITLSPNVSEQILMILKDYRMDTMLEDYFDLCLKILGKSNTNANVSHFLEGIMGDLRSLSMSIVARKRFIELSRVIDIKVELPRGEYSLDILKTSQNFDDEEDSRFIDDIDNIAGILYKAYKRDSKTELRFYTLLGDLASRHSDRASDLNLSIYLSGVANFSVKTWTNIEAFLRTRSQSVLLLQRTSERSLHLSESYWFWLLTIKDVANSGLDAFVSDPLVLRRAFSPLMARCIVEHVLGSKQRSAEVVSLLKKLLGQSPFESEFKNKFLSIIAFCHLFGLILGYESSIIIRSVDHVCSSLKLQYATMLDSFYGQILILELLNIADENPPLLDPVSQILSQVLSSQAGSLDGLVSKAISQLVSSSTSLPLEHKDSRQRLSAAANSKEACEYQRFHSHVDAKLGLANELYIISNTLSIGDTLAALKLALELVNSEDHAVQCNDLERLRLPKGQKLVFKTLRTSSFPDEPSEDDPFQWQTYQILRQIGWIGLFDLLRRRLLTTGLQWIILNLLQQGVIDINRTLNLYEMTDLADEKMQVIQGIKLYMMHHNDIDFSHNLDSYSDLCPYGILFLTEFSARKEIDAVSRAYNQIGEEDYKTYFDALNLQMDFDDQSLTLKKTENDCWLLQQRWTDDHLPEPFDCSNPNDAVFISIREAISADVGRFEIKEELSAAAKLACRAAFVRDEQTLLDIGLEAWDTVRKTERKSQYQTLQVIENFPLALNSWPLKLFADLCKGELFWKIKQPEKAVRLILEAAESAKLKCLQSYKKLQSLVMLRAAKYSWRTNSRPANYIKKTFLDNIDINELPTTVRSKAFHALATFFDAQYQRISSSEILLSRKRLLNQSKRELSKVEQYLESVVGRDFSTYEKIRTRLEDQIAQDHAEIESFLMDREQYAHMAALHFMNTLIEGEKYNLTVFRLCSLWFSFRKNAQINKLFENPRLPLHKLLPLMYQLAARLEQRTSEDSEAFPKTLQGLLYRILVSHPHHSLYQLMALKSSGHNINHHHHHHHHANKRKLVFAGGVTEGRARAASEIILRAKTTNARLGSLIGDTERLWAAYIEMAMTDLPMDTSTKVTHPFERSWSIKGISRLSSPVPTKSVAIDPSGDYEDLVHVHGFVSDGYRVVGGINMPKIVDCIGSDGQRYRQLVKGKDDVRQDAVMEQVFILVNRILANNEDDTRRKLQLRTYRVIPLQPLAGVIEWISNALPIGDYLMLAHERRNPNDLSPKEARALMKKEFDRPGSNPTSKFKVFTEHLLPRFHPVFRHFFTETTTSIREWFDKRLSYIRSTAVGSILGYIVGLGDRHCQNIMVDQNSGELIHIDLNMIFELGKTLRVPERVPFRLTRDIVDAMGFAGLEAGFSGSAGYVLRVLKSRKDSMLMIMEAFKYDPLYRWSKNENVASLGNLFENNQRGATAALNSDPAADLEGDGQEGEGHKEAERALLRVKEKLLGIEEGTLLSESGQVSFLIQQSTNEELLAQMYPGWQPWMVWRWPRSYRSYRQATPRLREEAFGAEQEEIGGLSSMMMIMRDLCQRVSHLEAQIIHLNQRQRQLSQLQTLLQLGETFKSLHRLLAKPAEGRRGLKLLSRIKLTEDDLKRTLEVCKLRNEAAHPTASEPDLSDVDPETMQLYLKVKRILDSNS